MQDQTPRCIAGIPELIDNMPTVFERVPDTCDDLIGVLHPVAQLRPSLFPFLCHKRPKRSRMMLDN